MYFFLNLDFVLGIDQKKCAEDLADNTRKVHENWQKHQDATAEVPITFEFFYVRINFQLITYLHVLFWNAFRQVLARFELENLYCIHHEFCFSEVNAELEEMARTGAPRRSFNIVLNGQGADA